MYCYNCVLCCQLGQVALEKEFSQLFFIHLTLFYRCEVYLDANKLRYNGVENILAPVRLRLQGTRHLFVLS